MRRDQSDKLLPNLKRKGMRFACGFVFVILIICCLVGRMSGEAAIALKRSAVVALESSFNDLAVHNRTSARATKVAPSPPTRPREPPAYLRSKQQSEKRHADPPTTKRRRVTPFQAKRVAAFQGWRCGCGCVDPDDHLGRGFMLDETFEIDHRIPTSLGGSHEPSNWVAVLRSHHQVKSGIETQTAARLKRQK